MAAWKAPEAHLAPTHNCHVREEVSLRIKTSIPFQKAKELNVGTQLTEEPAETDREGWGKVFREESQGSLRPHDWRWLDPLGSTHPTDHQRVTKMTWGTFTEIATK